MDDVREMVRALMRVARGLEQAKREGKAATLALLSALSERVTARPSELSVELGVHQSAVTRQVQALEAAGHVQVIADPADGRSCIVSLTAAGREEIDRLTQVGLGRFAAIVEDWDAADVRTLAQLLTRLETSQARVNRREPRISGRRWQQERTASTSTIGHPAAGAGRRLSKNPLTTFDHRSLESPPHETEPP